MTSYFVFCYCITISDESKYDMQKFGNDEKDAESPKADRLRSKVRRAELSTTEYRNIPDCVSITLPERRVRIY